jgi:hypothetical protein
MIDPQLPQMGFRRHRVIAPLASLLLENTKMALKNST